jgi:hypothetical protein
MNNKVQPYIRPEIVTQILSYLPAQDDRPDRFKEPGASDSSWGAQSTNEEDFPTANLPTLRNFYLSSKEMYDTAKIHMYSQFISNSYAKPDLRKFLQKIVLEPRLGQELQFISYENNLQRESNGICKLTPEEYDGYIEDRKLNHWHEDTPTELKIITEIIETALAIPDLSTSVHFGYLESYFRRSPFTTS